MLQSKPVRAALGDQALEVLASQDFHTVPYGARQDALAQRLGIDLSAVTFALTHVPLALNGPEHRRKRAAIGRAIRDGQRELIPHLPTLVETHFGPLARPGDVDVMDRCVTPFITAALARLTGCDPKTDMSMVSRIFSQSIGVSQRKRMQAQIAALRAELSEKYPNDDEAVGERIALLALGRDALVGTIALSLLKHLQDLSGAPLSSCPMAATPTRTGVPYIDRSAREGARFDGHDLAEGEQVRCQLASLEEAPKLEASRFFGAGAHVCLGRPISMTLFAEIADYLSAVNTHIDVLDFALRKDDVFRLPDRFTVRVSNV